MVKSFIGVMRSSFYIIDKEHIGDTLQADMWDDGWSNEKTTMPKKKIKVKLVALLVEKKVTVLVPVRSGKIYGENSSYILLGLNYSYFFNSTV